MSQTGKPPEDESGEEDVTRLADYPAAVGETDGDLPGQIGSFRPVRLLGSGGMGRVYLAEQLEPVQRQVALKVMGAGHNSAVARAYFEIERQVLAQMQHPAIAQVYDAGTSEDGQPWFAMEWVPGAPITDHCREYKLPRNERLNLFSRVCLGVHHAHQRGIIHRDLKPSNILVSRVDDRSEPKIIDFGIAVGVAAQGQAADMGSTSQAGTRAYMSPEQLVGESARVDVRSDVYSLGVVLFELLTGLRLPPGDRQSEIQGVRSALEKGRATSATATTLDDMAGESSVDSSPVGTIRHLPRELRCILARALATNPAERYQTAEALAADINAFLEGLPVEAVPSTRSYRWRKVLWRHRVAVAFAGVISLSMIAGLAVALWGLVQAQSERDRAQVEADRAERSLSFLTSMLSSIDPDYAEGADTELMRRVLEDATRQAEQELYDQPDIELEIQQVVGHSYSAIGEHDLAEQRLQRALELAGASGNTEHQRRASAALATLEITRGNHDRALELAEETLEATEAEFPPDHFINLDLKVTRAQALVFSGRPEEAREQVEPVIDRTEGVVDPELLPVRLQALRTLGIAYLDTRRYEESQRAHQTVQEEAERWGTPQGMRHFGIALNEEAVVLLRQQRYAEGEVLLRRSLEINEPRLGENHPMLLPTISNLASSLRQQDRHEESLPWFQRALSLARDRFGAESPQAITISYNMGNLHREMGETEEALRLQRWSLAAAAGAFSESSPVHGMFRLGLGRSELAGGNPAVAVELLEEAVSMLEEFYGRQYHRTIEAAENLAAAHEELGQSDMAETWRQRAADWSESE